MMNTLYEVLGGTKGDAAAKTYGDSLTLLDNGVSINAINDAFFNTINSEFKSELDFYCNRNYRVEEFVVWNMIEELQTYHYL